MKHLLVLLSLIPLAFTAIAQDDAVTKHANGHVSIASRGRDVRQVVHELFMQAGKNYVLDRAVSGDLYLALSDVEFDEALEIICHTAKLKYQTRNGICYIAMDKAAPASPEPIAPKETPKKERPKKGPKTKAPATASQAMAHTVTGSYHKKEIRDIFADLGRQAGATIIVADDIPKRFIDVTFGKTSLKYALSILTNPLKLRVEVRPDGSMYVTSATASSHTSQS